MSWSFYFIGSPDKAVERLNALSTDNAQGLLVKAMLLDQIKHGKPNYGNLLKIEASGHSSVDGGYGTMSVKCEVFHAELDEAPSAIQNVYVPVPADSPFLKGDGTPATLDETLEVLKDVAPITVEPVV